MTKLSKEISRETQRTMRGRSVVVTLIPGTDKREPLIALRLKGERLEYRGCISDCYRTFAFWHANAERKAKAEARKNGVPWKSARKQFLAR